MPLPAVIQGYTAPIQHGLDHVSDQIIERLFDRMIEPKLDHILADGWSELRYVDVNIWGIPESIVGLDDSGDSFVVYAMM